MRKQRVFSPAVYTWGAENAGLKMTSDSLATHGAIHIVLIDWLIDWLTEQNVNDGIIET